MLDSPHYQNHINMILYFLDFIFCGFCVSHCSMLSSKNSFKMSFNLYYNLLLGNGHRFLTLLRNLSALNNVYVPLKLEKGYKLFYESNVHFELSR